MKYARKAISLLLAMVMALSLTTGVWAENGSNDDISALRKTWTDKGYDDPFSGIDASAPANAAALKYVYTNYAPFENDEGKWFLEMNGVDSDDVFFVTENDQVKARNILNSYTSDMYTVLDDVKVGYGYDENAKFSWYVKTHFAEMLGAPLLQPKGGTGSVTNVDSFDTTYAHQGGVDDAKTYFNQHFDTYYDNQANKGGVHLKTTAIENGEFNNPSAAQAAVDGYNRLYPRAQIALNQLKIEISDATGVGEIYFWQLIDEYDEMLHRGSGGGSGSGGNQSGGGNRPATGNIKDISNLQNQDAKDYVNQYIDYNYNSQFDVTLVCFKNADIDDKTGLYADVTSCVNAINAYDAYMALSNSAKDALDELYVMDNSGNKCRFSAQMEALRQLADNGTGANNTSSSSSEFDEVNKALRNAGYTAPRLGVDFTVSFPAELVRGQDYDFTYSEDGVLTVIVLRGSEDRWLAAAENNQGSDTLMCRMTFINKGYSKYALINGNSGGSPWIPYIDGTMRLDNIRDGMVIGAGNSFAAVNFSGDTMSVASTSAYSDQRTLVVWDYGSGNGTLSENAVKYLLVFRIEIDKPFFYEEQDVTVPTAVETMRITVSDVDGNVWNVSTDNGEIKVQPKSADTVAGALSTQSGNDAELGTVTVTAPTGYTLVADKCNVLRGNGGSNFPGTNSDNKATVSIIALDGAAGTSKVKIVWKDSSDNTKVENLTINVVDKNVLDALEGQNIEVTTPKTSDVNTKPSSAATVTYGDDGIFYTTFNSNGDLPGFADMQKGVLLTPPEEITGQVTHFSSVSQERGTPTFSTENIAELRNAFESARQSGKVGMDVFPINDSDWNEERTLRYALTETQELLDGKVSVCYTFTQAYRFQIVQWLQVQPDGTFELLGYSYVGGKSDSFVSKTEVQSVAKPELADPNNPFVVGTGMEFVCDRYPQQTENGYMQYFQFHVRGEGMNQYSKFSVYLPYSYFGLTKEQGLALRDRGEKPVIYHYYDDHELRETIDGQYTEYGVRFEVSDFSPFVVDCSVASNSGSGSTGGGGHRVTTAVKADSPATFDAGIALYGALAISSLTGMAYVGKKKF